jgi:hypothetical protein
VVELKREQMWLMTILSSFGQQVEVTVNVRPRRTGRGGMELRP